MNSRDAIEPYGFTSEMLIKWQEQIWEHGRMGKSLHTKHTAQIVSVEIFIAI